ncbi:MAG: cache domain-containing protein [Thermodesulfobacteriota bacterium]
MRFDPWELRHISLKWKLLIPFLLLPVVLTIFNIAWGIYSQHQILVTQEEYRMRDNFRHLEHRIKSRLNFSGAMASLVAASPAAQKALAEKDRDELIREYRPLFDDLRTRVGIKQLHFHLYPPRSFLRLHRLEEHGDDLGYRETIRKACETGGVVTGLEIGLTGFGLRGVAPIFYQGRLVGSVEFGSSLEQPFLYQFKEDFGLDLTIYVPAPDAPRGFNVLATTSGARTFPAPETYGQVLEQGRTVFLTFQAGNDRLAVLAGPVFDFKGRAVAVIEITVNRAVTLGLIQRHILWLVTFGLVLLVLALIFVWRISTLFLAPIGTLISQAGKIADGERVGQLEVKVRDEFGVLAQALNRMLASLEASRERLRNQAHELEIRVQQRTGELVQSEEKFRTLVENIPLVVYRLERDLIRSFVSNHIERLTGWPPEDVVGGPAVWSSLIHPRDRNRVVEAKRRALETGEVFEMEYCLQDRQGQEVDVLDHAEPVVDESGRLLFLEGYMLDVRESRRLREQAIKSEELKTLSEISSRLAHEFRNPLSVVGLSARRLAKVTPITDSRSLYVEFILEAISRLEQIINMIQSYIQPMGLSLKLIEIDSFFRDLARRGRSFLSEKEARLVLDFSDGLPWLNLDPDLMGRAVLNLMKNAAFQIPPRGTITFRVAPNHKTVEIKLIYPAGYLPDDQLRHFFYPFTTEEADSSLVDLPLVPVIIHKHRGIINVVREGEDLVAVSIILPIGEADRKTTGERAD